MFAHLGPGEWVAIVFGLIASAKWVGDTAIHWIEKWQTKEDGEGARMTQLLSDFAVHKAEDKKDFEAVEKGIARVEGRLEAIDRSILGLQHQMSMVATNSHNKLFTSDGEK